MYTFGIKIVLMMVSIDVSNCPALRFRVSHDGFNRCFPLSCVVLTMVSIDVSHCPALF